jgi:tRNA modification GTPase
MYDINDTIVAVSSPTANKRVIIRLAGPRAFDLLSQLSGADEVAKKKQVTDIDFNIEGINFHAALYTFVAPKSYTGSDMAELHFWAGQPMTNLLLETLIASGAVLARPGEFTQRAYLNGKLDLVQAEAVNEIITATNRLQLAAAEKLLTGSLSKSLQNINELIIDLLAYTEAGIDFAADDIELLPTKDALAKIDQITSLIDELDEKSLLPTQLAALPSVAIAGAPNAGKSSLLNRLLKKERAIVSSTQKTTRDVLTGTLDLPSTKCVIFDCAGLLINPKTQIDQLAQAAAVNAINKAQLVLLCVDINDIGNPENAAVSDLFQNENILGLATKVDLIKTHDIKQKLAELKNVTGSDFLPVSSKTEIAIPELLNKIDQRLTACDHPDFDRVTVNLRHRNALSQARQNVIQARQPFNSDATEVAALFLRQAHHQLNLVQTENLEEKVLQNIFSRFCIGK